MMGVVSTSQGIDCIYVSPGTGVHDTRWLSALTLLRRLPQHIRRDAFATDKTFVAAVQRAANDTLPVIAGPLKIASTLIEAIDHLVLLSWGFDLQEASTELNLTKFAAVIVDSRANERLALTAGAKRVVLIPWGIDFSAIESDAQVTDLTKFGVAADEKVILSLRAHEELYRVADVIEGFARAPIDARLVIGNTGSLTPELKESAARLGVDAVFLPAVDESEVPSLLRRSSVYVTASRVDGSSVTLLQAMACGVPVVASANTGNLDWIEDGVTGFLFPIADIGALSSALSRAFDDGLDVTEQARAQVELRADWQRNIQQLIPLLTRPQ